MSRLTRAFMALSVMVHLSACGGATITVDVKDKNASSQWSSQSISSVASSHVSMSAPSSPPSSSSLISDSFSSDSSDMSSAQVSLSSDVAQSSETVQSSEPTQSSDAGQSSSQISGAIPAAWLEEHPQGVANSVPSLRIQTQNSALIETKETYLQATYELHDATGVISGNTDIRGRGNSTWNWVKKPYRLRLANATELLGMPANRHWALLANYADKTLVRNDVTFRLAEKLGMEYTPRSRHLEIYLNGEYQGLYQLTEHIRTGSHRVNIDEMSESDNFGDALTGGYLMEVDFRMNNNYCAGNFWDANCEFDLTNWSFINKARQTTFCIDSSYGMEPVCIDTPDSLLDPSWSAQRQYITQYITDFETALFGSNFTDPQTGYAAFVDVDSVINYYIVNEFVKNPDGAITSFWLYKKRNDKIIFGPVWDFDLSLGNAGYDDLEKTSGWQTRKGPWFDRLFQDPAFKTRLTTRWNQAKHDGVFADFFAYAEARIQWLELQQQRNYRVWSVTDFDPFIEHGKNGGTGSYAAEAAEMLRWQRERFEWMDAQLNQ